MTSFQHETTVHSRLKRVALTLLVLFVMFGCSGDNQTEEAIRSFVKEAEIAVEQGDIRTLRSLIAEDYADPSGRTKKDLIQYVTFQVLRKKSIYLFISISSISFPDDKTAAVDLVAAMTGSPAESKNALLELQADVYTFSCTLRQSDNQWLLNQATWKPAMLEDLIPQ